MEQEKEVGWKKFLGAVELLLAPITIAPMNSCDAQMAELLRDLKTAGVSREQRLITLETYLDGRAGTVVALADVLAEEEFLEYLAESIDNVDPDID